VAHPEGIILTREIKKRVKRFLAYQGHFKQGPVQPTDSAYLRWLSFANAGMLNSGNIDCFEYAIKNLPSAAPVVEIGSFCGLSTNVISYFLEKHKSKSTLFTCDKWIFEGAEDGALLDAAVTISHEEYRNFVKETYLRNTKVFSRDHLPYTVEAFSDEFFSLWESSAKCRDVFGRDCTLGGPISFCYIDGNHTYEFAKRDFEHCDKFLVAGGFVLFDDSAHGSDWGVCKVVEEVLRSRRYELIAANPNYFFRKLN
jgi:hypothetical protein